MTLIHWLLEPGTTRLAYVILFAFAGLCFVCWAVSKFRAANADMKRMIDDAAPRVPQPRQPSTRATTSSRKSGRVRHG